jgi:glycosyltransferase involved in cell wall biosynthesis
MPRVLFLSHAAGSGGAEKCLALLLERLPHDRHRPTVLMRRRPWPLAKPSGLEANCLAWGLDPRHVDLKWWVRDWQHDAAFAARLGRRVERIANVIRAERIDLVMTNTSAVVEGALAARQCGVPHVWHVLEMLSRDPVLKPFLPLPRFYALLDELSQRIVVVSRAVRDEIAQFVPSARIEIVATGLPPAQPRADAPSKRALFGAGDDDPIVTFVGLLSRRKGVLDLIEAIRPVLRDRPTARFVFVGRDGGERAEMQRRIDRQGLRQQVRLLGRRSDVPDILTRSDLLVLPALADPLPVAVLEAMSMAVPVVATRSGGCEEMVVDGETGRLVPVSDSTALAAAIVDVLCDDARRRAMGQRGRERFLQHYNQDACATRFCKVFDDVLSAASRESLAPIDVAPLVNELAAAARRRRAEACGGASLAERLRERALTLAYRLAIVR